MRTQTLPILLALTSCAHAPVEAPAPVPPDAAAVLLDARDFVSAGQCMSVAHDVYTGARKPGWSLLVACIARADFNDLEGLLDVDAPWAAELKQRRDAASLVVRVMARRGGNIDRDLRLCRRAGLRLYSLRAALADPEAMEGGLVVMRGSVAEIRKARAARAIEVEETRPMNDDDYFASDDELARRRLRRTTQALDEMSVETGLSLVARVPMDAIFEPQIDYIMLLRFDGERELIGNGAKRGVRTALGTVVAQYEPELTLLSWLPQR